MTPDLALFIDPATEHFLEDRLFDPAASAYGGDDILAPYRAVREHFREACRIFSDVYRAAAELLRAGSGKRASPISAGGGGGPASAIGS